MTTPAETRDALLLRRPRFAFAALGLGLLFSIGYGLCVFIASGVGYDARIAEAFAWPAAIGAGLAGGLLWRRVKVCKIRRRRDAAVAAALAFGAAGFAWPLSFGAATLFEGAIATWLLPALAGGALGAAAGAAAGFAAGFAVLTRT